MMRFRRTRDDDDYPGMVGDSQGEWVMYEEAQKALAEAREYEGSTLERLDVLVHELTGDEGEDDSFTVLRRKWDALRSYAVQLRDMLRQFIKTTPSGGFETRLDRDADGLLAKFAYAIGERPDADDKAMAALVDDRQTAQALHTLYTETADYIERNNLGPVHHNQSMQAARDALMAEGMTIWSEKPEPHDCSWCKRRHVGYSIADCPAIADESCHETCTKDWLPRIAELSEQVAKGSTGYFSAMQQLVGEVQAELRHQSCTKPFRAARCCPVSVTCEREGSCSGMCPVRCRPGAEFQVGRNEADLIRRASDLFERWNSTDIDPDDEEYEPWIADFTASVASWLDDADCLVAGNKPSECSVCRRDPKSNPYGYCPVGNGLCPHQP